MEPYLGLITQFAFLYAPQNWMECAGQSLDISTNQALYALLSTKFGGNGTTNFCLPDMRNASLFNSNGPDGIMKYYIAVAGIFPPRD